MSLRKNIIANYSSQVYIILISILTLPQLVKYLGAEAYGLVGFFSMAQSWLTMLDLGMSPTMAREVSRYRGGILDSTNLLAIFGTLRKFFLIVGALFIVVFVSLSGVITKHWLNIETLDYSVVVYSVLCIVFIVVCRWLAGFYRATVNGFEQLVWLGTFNAIVATFRFVLIFPVFFWIKATPVAFFTYQLIVAIVELFIIGLYVKRLLPASETGKEDIDKEFIRKSLKFSLTIAFTAAVWVMVTQTDKLLLSNLMKLSEFGYFTLAVQVAGGILLIGGPISSAIMPRLVKLEAENKHDELILLYRKATQFIVVIAGSVSLMLIFFSKQVLFVWSGNMELTEKVSPYLILYGIGNFILSVAAFPYYLQYAKGKLRFHVYGNVGFLLFLVPTLIFLVNKYGGIGAGYVWVGLNALYFLFWIPIIHNHFEKGLNRNWYLTDIAFTIFPGLIAGYCFSLVFEEFNNNRIFIFLLLAGVFIVVFVLNIFASQMLRGIIINRIKLINSRWRK